jgi:Domain of unknown function (DUF4360)
MNKLRNNILVLLASALASLLIVTVGPGHAIADPPPDIEIIEADIGGSGCPMGTAQAILSADKRTLSIIFDQYYGEDNEYASCNIAISLSVPEGFTVALIDIDYRGYASIPDLPGRKARFRTEYFFAGDMGPVRIANFGRGYDASFMILHDIVGTVWAPCGDEVIARANTSIRTWGYGSFLAIDTADVTTNGITFYLDWAEC